MVDNNVYDIEFDVVRGKARKFSIIVVRNNKYNNNNLDYMLAKKLKEREDFDIYHKADLGLTNTKEDIEATDYKWDNDIFERSHESIWTKIMRFIKNYICCRGCKVKPL
jgi:hypothetical protein